MNISFTKCNFAKLINFITSINGKFYNVSIDAIVDSVYDNTWEYNEDEMSNTMYSGYDDIGMIILEAMEDDISYNTSISIDDDEYSCDCINVWMTINDNETYVLSLEKSIYGEKLNEWLSNNAQHITKEV